MFGKYNEYGGAVWSGKVPVEVIGDAVSALCATYPDDADVQAILSPELDLADGQVIPAVVTAFLGRNGVPVSVRGVEWEWKIEEKIPKMEKGTLGALFAPWGIYAIHFSMFSKGLLNPRTDINYNFNFVDVQEKVVARDTIRAGFAEASAFLRPYLTV